MKYKLFGTLLFFLVFSNSMLSQDFFEGEMYFKVSYKSLDKNLASEKAMISELGDSITSYIKEDKFVLLRNSKGKYGKRKTIFFLEKGFSYVEYENLDTIFKYNIKKKPGILLKFKRNTEKKYILNNNCESITIEYKPKQSKNQFFNKISGEYFFSSSKFKLNSKIYSNYKSNFWNLYVQESGAVSLKSIVKYFPFFESTQEAYAIIKRKLPESIFIVNKDKFIKAMD